MICPQCQKTIDDGVAICPLCDAILDMSILGEIPDEDSDSGSEKTMIASDEKTMIASSDERTMIVSEPEPDTDKSRTPFNASAPGSRRVAAASRRTGPIPPKPAASPNRSPAAGSAALNRRPSSAARPNGASRSSLPQLEAPDAYVPNPDDPWEQLKSVYYAFLDLHFEDKLTASSACAVILLALMPWRSTPETDDIGFLTWGFFTVVLAIGAVVTIWGRKTFRFNFMPAKYLPMVACGAGALSALIAFVFIVDCFEKRLINGKPQLVAWPTTWVFLSLTAALGVAIGGLLTFRREA